MQNDEIASNPLWDYSVTVYSREGVAPVCIELQDTFALDVNLLLYAAWLASRGRRLSQSHLGELAALIADWREQVITPLRSLRRQLRTIPGAQEIRAGTKALELRAERQQQAMMYAYYQQAAELAVAHHPLEDNLVLVARSARPASGGWTHQVQRLISLLPL